MRKEFENLIMTRDGEGERERERERERVDRTSDFIVDKKIGTNLSSFLFVKKSKLSFLNSMKIFGILGIVFSLILNFSSANSQTNESIFSIEGLNLNNENTFNLGNGGGNNGGNGNNSNIIGEKKIIEGEETIEFINKKKKISTSIDDIIKQGHFLNRCIINNYYLYDVDSDGIKDIIGKFGYFNHKECYSGNNSIQYITFKDGSPKIKETNSNFFIVINEYNKQKVCFLNSIPSDFTGYCGFSGKSGSEYFQGTTNKKYFSLTTDENDISVFTLVSDLSSSNYGIGTIFNFQGSDNVKEPRNNENKIAISTSDQIIETKNSNGTKNYSIQLGGEEIGFSEKDLHGIYFKDITGDNLKDLITFEIMKNDKISEYVKLNIYSYINGEYVKILDSIRGTYISNFDSNNDGIQDLIIKGLDGKLRIYYFENNQMKLGGDIEGNEVIFKDINGDNISDIISKTNISGITSEMGYFNIYLSENGNFIKKTEGKGFIGRKLEKYNNLVGILKSDGYKIISYDSERNVFKNLTEELVTELSKKYIYQDSSNNNLYIIDNKNYINIFSDLGFGNIQEGGTIIDLRNQDGILKCGNCNINQFNKYKKTEIKINAYLGNSQNYFIGDSFKTIQLKNGNYFILNGGVLLHLDGSIKKIDGNGNCGGNSLFVSEKGIKMNTNGTIKHLNLKGRENDDSSGTIKLNDHIFESNFIVKSEFETLSGRTKLHEMYGNMFLYEEQKNGENKIFGILENRIGGFKSNLKFEFSHGGSLENFKHVFTSQKQIYVGNGKRENTTYQNLFINYISSLPKVFLNYSKNEVGSGLYTSYNISVSELSDISLNDMVTRISLPTRYEHGRTSNFGLNKIYFKHLTLFIGEILQNGDTRTNFGNNKNCNLLEKMYFY